MSDWQPPILRTPKGRGGMGAPRAKGYERKRLGVGKDASADLRTRVDIEKYKKSVKKWQKGMKRVSKAGRMQEKLMAAAKVLVCQEYSEALGIPVADLAKLDLDHVSGRNELGFALSAKVDFLNLQLLPRKIHEWKTNPPKWAWWTSRTDFRPFAVEERLVALSRRVQAILGPAWTWAELLQVLRGQRFAKTPGIHQIDERKDSVADLVRRAQELKARKEKSDGKA